MSAAETEGAQRGFLSTTSPGPGERRLAQGVALASLVAFGICIPFVRVPLAPVPAFIPAYESALWVNDFITAVLLFGQFARVRSGALLVLAGGYLFNATLIAVHALSFPGAFAPTGLLGAGPQTTAWLFAFWHGGFPLFVLAYVLLSRRAAARRIAAPGRAMALAIAAILLLCGVLTLLATAGHDLLPAVMNGTDYTGMIRSGVSPAMWLLTILTFLAVWLRGAGTVLDLWLTQVMLACVLEIAVVSIFGTHRYDLGFYAGRVFGLLSASFVLAVLLIEMSRLYGRLALAFDLAERRNAELARSREEFARVQRFEAIGQLVGGVAHDFNNLLTVITGSLDLMLRDPELGPRRRLLDMSMKAAQRGEQLTQQLLTFARRQVLRPEVMNPNEVIAGLETFMTRGAGETMRVELTLSPVLWPARLDRTQFETALVNLVLNARDASGGTGRIVIETANVKLAEDEMPDIAAGDFVRVSVRDFGSGMPPDVAAHAFDPFFTTKEIGKGSGLGLSQVYGFVRSMSGQVRIESAPGDGTVVHMYLPKSAERPPQPVPAGLAPLRATAGHELVLVVEDDPDVLNIAVSGLLQLGYRVKTASDAKEALALLRREPEIDVLFSDVVMPGGMNGAQLAAEAERIRPGLRVLLTSGYTASALSEDHGLPERLEVLRKPYRREELATKLQLVIRR